MALRPQLVCSTGCGLCCIVLGSPKDTFWFRLTWDLCPEKRVRVLVAMARLPQTSAEVSICPVGLHTSPAAPGEVWCVQVSGSVPPPPHLSYPACSSREDRSASPGGPDPQPRRPASWVACPARPPGGSLSPSRPHCLLNLLVTVLFLLGRSVQTFADKSKQEALKNDLVEALKRKQQC